MSADWVCLSPPASKVINSSSLDPDLNPDARAEIAQVV